MLARGVLVAAIVALLDQWSKIAIIKLVQEKGHPIEVTSFFNIYQVGNKGVSFGMFNYLEHAPWIFSVLAIVVVVVLLFWLRKAENMLTAMGIAFVIGGAIGNTIDRLRFGAVVDFLDFHVMGYHWPAFNIADSAIFLGVVALLWESISNGKKTEVNVEEGVKEEKNEQ